MTNLFSKIKFTVNDVIIILALSAMWYDLKTDFQVFKATTELRIDALERQSNVPQEANITHKNREAVLPNEIKLKFE